MRRPLLTDALLLAIRDVSRCLERCLAAGPSGLAWTLAGLLIGWWIYVPCHELLHALGCVATGGTVTRLEVSPLYGGAVLARVFPFVVPESEYAGRLSGFDTGGSDLTYLASDLGPFVLTLFPGVWAMRYAGAARRPFLFGLAVPLAFAPFLSLTGDAYEIGSILVTRLGPWSSPSAIALIRGDDLFKRLAALHAEGRAGPWVGAILAAVLGAGWAWATYSIGAVIARALGRPASAAS